LSISWRAVDRIFPQSHRIPHMSRHTDSSYRAEHFRFVDGAWPHKA
jgi:hypothetical protein